MRIKNLQRYGLTILMLIGLFAMAVSPVSADFTPMPNSPEPLEKSSSPGGSNLGEPREVLLGYDVSPAELDVSPSSAQATGGAYSLSLDSGTYSQRMCSQDIAQQLTWNKFTPADTAFPFTLNQVSAIIDNTYSVGDPIQVLIYSDPDGIVDNGAELLAAENFTVQYNDHLTWNVFNLTTPVVVPGPGDVLVGMVIRLTKNVGAMGWDLVCPAFLDNVAWKGNSFMGTYLDSSSTLVEPPALPSMPPSQYYPTEGKNGDYVFITGNLMIRAKGVEGCANCPPVVNNQTVNTNEDTPVNVNCTATDPESDPITYSILTNPANGALTGTMPNMTYTPNANINGADSFTYRANDGHHNSRIATVTINVAAVNDPPVASDQSVSTDRDVAKNITLSATDVEGDALTYAVVAGPTNGKLTGEGANLTYTPNSGYAGPDSFTFKANDGAADSNVATVSITVISTNQKPVADAKSLTTPEDTAGSVTLSGSDPEGASISYSIVTGPAHGTLSGTLPEQTYMPNANYNGTDAFTYRVYDGEVYSDNATVSITVEPVNDTPIANNQAVSTDEDIAKVITLTASDADGDNLTYHNTNPIHGVLTGTAPDLTYTPTANYYGDDSFTFYVHDGKVNSATATVSITVVSVNDRPVANNKTVTTDEDVAVPITLTGSDVETSTLTFSIVSPPDHGALSGTPPNMIYTPAANYHGSDAFTYRADDGGLYSENAVVSITVNSVNDVPVASAQTVTTNEDTPVAITLAASDADGDKLTYTYSNPTKGTLSGTAPSLTYTPNLNANGSDSFTFYVNDGTVNSNTATVSITITPVNDKPVADAKTITTAEDTPAAVTLSGSDVEGSSLTYSIVSNPSHGTLSGDAPNLTYTPTANYNGADAFTYRIYDGSIYSDNATVSITVTAVNDAPIATAQTVSTDEDTAKSITLLASDVDGDKLTYNIIDNPQHGALSGTAPNLTYTPAGNYYGADEFTFSVYDGKLTSNTAKVSITVNSVNDRPVADKKDVTTEEDTSVAVTLSGSDVEGSTLTYSIVSNPSHGTLSGSMPNLTYAPTANYNGADAFTYRVYDGSLYSEYATVSITITPVNDAPTVANQTVTTDEDTAKAMVLSASDVDGDTLTYYYSNPLHGVLSGTVPNLTYTPSKDYYGSDSFTFYVDDGSVQSDIGTVDITVKAVNDRPVAKSKNVTISEDTSVSVVLSGTDVEGSALTYNVVSTPSHGTLSGTSPNLTYTPAANYNGVDAFTYQAYDGGLYSEIATVNITITPVNDAPTAGDQAITTDEDKSASIALEVSDVDGDSLTFTLLSSPAHGTLTGTAPDLTYTPAANFFGDDAFTYKANDGTVDSNVATVSIKINSVNDAPVADNKKVTTAEDTSTSVTLSGSDVEGSALTFSVVDGPAHGTLSGTAPNLTYMPSANYSGADSFIYTVNDGEKTSEKATVSIAITPVNDSPTADNKTVTTAEDTPAAVLLSGSDVEGSALSYEILSGPAHGNLSGTGANRTYTPSQDYNGADTITYRVSDGELNSAAATVNITVTAVNDLPVAGAQTITANEDEGKAITLAASDVDGDKLSYHVSSDPAHGTLSGTAPELTYTPALNYYGDDSFTFYVNDGSGDSNTAVVNITVKAVNDAPTADSQSSLTTEEDQPLDLTLTGSDVEGDTLTYAIVQGPAHGALAVSGASVTYTPAANYNGGDSFTFKVNDGLADSNIATVSLTVSPVNDAPAAVDQAVSTLQDTPKPVLIVVNDVDGDALTYTILTTPAHGALSGTAPNLTYTPASGYRGPDTFTFKGNDGVLDSNVATVTISVSAVNHAPTAMTLTGSTVAENKADGTLVGSFTTTDPDPEESHIYSLVNGAGADDNAAFAISGSTLLTGTVLNHESKNNLSIRVRTTDKGGLFYEAIYAVTVTDVNEAPFDIGLSSKEVTDQEPAGTVVGTLSASDPDEGDTAAFSLSGGTGDADNASFEITGSTLKTKVAMDLKTKPEYSIRVKVTDASGLSYEKVFTITVAQITPTGGIRILLPLVLK